MTEILATYIGPNSIAITTDEKPYNIHSTSPNYQRILDLFIEAGDQYPEWDELEPLLDVAQRIRRQTAGTGVVVTDSEVLYNDEPLHGAVVTHLLQLLSRGINLEPWKKFLVSLMANPSYKSREQLYGFMEANGITIDQNGNLLLYKKVRADYFDVHTGRTHKNAVGAVIEMDRSQVDDDPNRTCSSGLHVAAPSYIPHFDGQRVMICAVSPQDVVSIPTDYKNAKMRVCKYTVVAEQKAALTAPTLNDPYADTSEWGPEDDEWADDDDRNGF